MPVILAAMTDLFFLVQITEAAKSQGLKVHLMKDPTEDIGHPAFVVLDLNCSALDPISLIKKIKGDEATSHIRTVGFVSHVQTALRQQAKEAGCDLVFARSAFSQQLPWIFQPGPLVEQ